MLSYDILQFIAHPFSQLMLNYEVYRKYPTEKDKNFFLKFLTSIALAALFPLWVFCYFFLPNSHVTSLLRTPLVKYGVFIGFYLVFLLMVSFTVFQSETAFLRFSLYGKSQQWGLQKGFREKRHLSKAAKNVTIILFKNIDSRKATICNSNSLFFTSTNQHLFALFRQRHDETDQHNYRFLWFLFTFYSLESLETKLVTNFSKIRKFILALTL